MINIKKRNDRKARENTTGSSERREYDGKGERKRRKEFDVQEKEIKAKRERDDIKGRKRDREKGWNREGKREE